MRYHGKCNFQKQYEIFSENFVACCCPINLRCILYAVIIVKITIVLFFWPYILDKVYKNNTIKMKKYREK